MQCYRHKQEIDKLSRNKHMITIKQDKRVGLLNYGKTQMQREMFAILNSDQFNRDRSTTFYVWRPRKVLKNVTNHGWSTKEISCLIAL